MLELLEDRLAPATFAEAGMLLNLDFNVASKSVAVVSAGTSYAFTLTGDTWSGTDSANVTGNGTALLTVTAAGLAAFDTVNITDSAAGSAVNFNNSGLNAYADHINVTLDHAAAGAISFTGATSFSGSAALSASTTKNIVVNAGAAVSTVDGNLTLNANQQLAPTVGTFAGVSVSGLVQATGAGAVTVKGKGGTIGASQHGVLVQGGGDIIGGTTNLLTVQGKGGASPNDNNYGVLVTGAGSTITSGGANVFVTGTGGGTGISIINIGIRVETAGLLSAGGNGTVSAVGNGGNTTGTGSFNHGLQVEGANAKITSSGGNVSATGAGGGATTSTVNIGLIITNGAQITAANNGTVTVIGNGGNLTGTGGANHGVEVNGANSAVTSSGGNVSVTGTGGGAATSTVNIGLLVDGAGQISAGGAGTVTAIGNGGNTTGSGSFNHGLQVDQANSKITSSGGNVSATGTGGGAGTSSVNIGVLISRAAQITAANNGTVTVVGNGGNLTGSGNFNHGTQVVDANSAITSGGGNVSVTGTGGGAATSAVNLGVVVNNAAQITAASNGSVTVIGHGGNTTGTGDNNIGVQVFDANSKITSSGGNVSVTGAGGGANASTINHGVLVNGAGQITAGGTGEVEVIGNGGNLTGAGGNNFGIGVADANSKITSAGGNISLTGTGGGAGASDSNVGIIVRATGVVTAPGSAALTVQGTGGTGTGGFNYGVLTEDANSAFTTVDGPLRITGIGGTGGANNHGVRIQAASVVKTTGAGDVTITGTPGPGATSFGFTLSNAFTTGAKLESTGTGDITVIADSIDITATESILAGANVVTLHQLASGTSIDVGGADAAGTLGLSDAELDRITAGVLTIGSPAKTGPVRVTAAISPANAGTLALRTGGSVTELAGGSVTVDKLLLTGAGAFALEQPGNAFNTLAAAVNGSISLRDDGNLAIGTVAGVNGIATQGGHVEINTPSINTITVAQIIDTTPGSGGQVATGPNVSPITPNALYVAGAGHILLNASFTDDFNRADNADLGANWTTQSGAWGINANRAAASVANVSLATLKALSLSDVILQSDVIDVTAPTARAGLMARYTGTGEFASNFYLGMIWHDPDTLRYDAYLFVKRNGQNFYQQIGAKKDLTGFFTGVGSLRFEVVGSQLKLFVNNVLQLIGNDSTITAPGLVGMRGKDSFADNFSVAPGYRRPAVLPFTDTFTRADGSSLDRVWTERAGAFTIQGNAAVATDAVPGVSVATLNITPAADTAVQASITVPNTHLARAGLLARYSGPGDTNYYVGMVFNNNGVYEAYLFRNQGGVFTQLAFKNLTGIFTGAGSLRFEVAGNQLKLFVNNILQLVSYDSAITAPGLVGIRNLNATLDDFTAAAIPPLPTNVPFTDAFTKPDHSDLDRVWTERSGAFTIQGNEAEATDAVPGVSIATLNTPPLTDSDTSAKVDLDNVNGARAGLLARYAGPADSNYYVGMVYNNNGVYEAYLFLNQGGVFTQLGFKNLTGIFTGAGTVRFRVAGNTLDLFVNGGLQITATNSALTTGLVGMRNLDASLDDFNA